MTTTPDAKRPPIAVVGVSALFPGSVDSTGFWNDILAGTDRITDVPPSHWLIDDYFDEDMTAPDKTYGRRGGFLTPIDLDVLGFGIPPNTLPSTDTAQLLALIVAQRVLDDATRGQFSELDRSHVSVILGVTSGQELLGAMASRMNRPMWLQGMRRAGVPEDVALAACEHILNLHPEWTESTFPGLLGNVVAGRIANRLDLGGTNCVTDAACASSFSAISMGVNELYLGDSEMVIAGGVDTMNDILMYMCFSKTPALSKSEDIRPFSDQADGTMLGEGIGMVALKRLDDAERDGNNIYCVINGVGASSDGRSKSVYAPVSAGQARALENAYAKSGYGVDTVELVEAHGTGTVAGDAAEFGGLKMVFESTDRADRQWCALGSVKSQIGHTKSAAGAAGLFKVVMALHHKVLPQTAKIDKPNPKLDLENSPFHLNTRTRPWVRGSDHERRGSVSSFGFGGSNFHLALSEYVGTGIRAPRLRTSDVELVVLTADSGHEVAALAQRHIVDATAEGYLTWLAQTTQRAYRADAAARLAVVATDETDLRTKLASAIERIASDPTAPFSTPTGIHYGAGPIAGDVAFVFPGQGSQYVFMGADLAMSQGEAMKAWDVSADVSWGTKPLHDVVFPITSFEPDADAASQALLTETQWAQPAIGTMSLGLLRVLRSIGVHPAHLAGHSFGEITALHAANVLSETDMIRVARSRGELMAQAAQTPGSMTAVSGSIEDVRSLVDLSGIDVVVANHNSPTQVVLSGNTPAIEQIEAELAGQKITFKRLPVATAFHSPVVSGAAGAFTEFLEGVDFNAPTIPVHANETAEPYPTDDVAAIRIQLGRQLANPVRFVEMIEAMYEAGARTFVEVGPSSVLTAFIGKVLKGRDHQAIPMDNKNKTGLVAFLGGIAQLAATGVEMDLGVLWNDYGETSNPNELDQPKLAIAINGANYGRSYPPRDLSELVGPNPAGANGSSPTASVAAGGTIGPVAVPPTARATVSPGSLPLAAPAPVAAPTPSAPAPTPSAPAPTPSAPAPTPSAPAPTPVAPASGSASGTPSASFLVAFQAVQQQTADAHAAYMNAMAQVHRTFLDSAQQSLDVLGRLAGTGATAARLPVVPSLPIMTSPAVAPAAVVSAPATMPVAPIVAVTAPAPVSPLPTPGIAGAPTPPSEPTAAGSSGLSFEALTKLLLDVVADKTGYPAEMLSMQMELESDLGIDSIKRVEILSAMQDEVPELPEVDTAVMAELVTLGQIVDYLQSQLPAPGTTANGTTPNGTTPNGTAPNGTGSSGLSFEALTKLLLDVVADKTGYPAEMLSMQMELESDLGIDSIKRVEILSAMQDEVPELPEVDTAVMAELVTLGQIVDYLQSQLPAPGTTANGTTPNGTTPNGTTPNGTGSSGLSFEALTKLLLDVVADKTGYPAEMLSMQMELESDLGIDSIKRVEILSAMQDEVPELPEVDTAVMAELVTLGQIVDYLQSQLRGPGDSVPAPLLTSPTTANGTASSPPALIGRFTLDAVESPSAGIKMSGLHDGKIAVIDDKKGVGKALVALLGNDGVDAELITTMPSSGYAGAVFLGGLRKPANVDEAVAMNREAFNTAKAIAGSAGVFVTVTDLGGAFGCDGIDELQAWTSGITALTRTAAIEWPDTTVKTIDIERGKRRAGDIAGAIADELLRGGPECEVGLGKDGTRVTLRSTRVDVEPGSMPLGSSDVIVVSGGARGVTAATMIELARASSARFVLLGRTNLEDEPDICHAAASDAQLKRVLLDAATAAGTPISPADLGRQVRSILANREVRHTIASIEEAGGQARYVAVDITDGAAVALVLAGIRDEIGPITGVVHGAGVLADKLIAEKTDTQFDAVFDTKVEGLRALLSATADDQLKLLCLFSSVAARAGNNGQADYAMANEVLNKVAVAEHQRRGAGCVVKSLGWGPWAGGMVGPALEAHFVAMGVTVIPLDTGARMLVEEIASPQVDHVELVIGGGTMLGSSGPAAAERAEA